MEKNRLTAYIYWGLSLLTILTALLISDNEITKQVILYLILSVLWFIGGLLHWKRRKK